MKRTLNYKSAFVKFARIFVLVVISLASYPTSSFAYVLLHQDDTYATSTASGAITDQTSSWKQTLDCGLNGIGSISNLGVTVLGTGSSGDFSLVIDTEHGTATSTNTQSTAGSATYNLSFDFSPPVNCNGGIVTIRPHMRSSTDVHFQPHAFNGSGDFYDELPNSNLSCDLGTAGGNCARIAQSVGSDLKWIIWGEVASSTPASGGGSGTTTYVSVDTDNLNTILVSFGTLLVTLLMWTLTHILFRHKMGK